MADNNSQPTDSVHARDECEYDDDAYYHDDAHYNQHTPDNVDNAHVNVEDDSDEVVTRPRDTSFLSGVPPAAAPREAVIPPLAQAPAPASAAPASTPGLLRGNAGAGPSRPSLGVSSAFPSGGLGVHSHNHNPKKQKRAPAHTPSAVGCSCECCPHSDGAQEAEYQLGAYKRKLAKTTAELSKALRVITAARACCMVCSEPFDSEKGKYPVLFLTRDGHACRPWFCNQCADRTMENKQTCPICHKPLMRMTDGAWYTRDGVMSGVVFGHTNLVACDLCEETHAMGGEEDHARVCTGRFEFVCGNYIEYEEPGGGKVRHGCSHVSQSRSESEAHAQSCRHKLIPTAVPVESRPKPPPAPPAVDLECAPPPSASLALLKSAASHVVASSSKEMTVSAGECLAQSLWSECGIASGTWTDTRVRNFLDGARAEMKRWVQAKAPADRTPLRQRGRGTIQEPLEVDGRRRTRSCRRACGRPSRRMPAAGSSGSLESRDSRQTGAECAFSVVRQDIVLIY
eukprot:jgi/Mesvir1/10957/Mv11498-RA.1